MKHHHECNNVTAMFEKIIATTKKHKKSCFGFSKKSKCKITYAHFLRPT